MKLYEYQRSRSFNDWPKSSRFNIFKLLFLSNHQADCSQISCGASFGWRNISLFKWSRSHDQDGRHAHMPIYCKILQKSSILEPKGRWPWNLVCSIEYSLEYYQVCLNDDPGLTLTYFMARSNLFPYAFVWENVKIMDFRNYCSLWIKVVDAVN